MTIERIFDASPDVVEMFVKLIPQLSTSTPAPDVEDVERFLAQPAVHLLAFRDDDAASPTCGQLLGMLTLATFEIPTGKRGWIEDVVVDEAARGKGAGQALVEAAVELGAQLGLKSIDLTSRPSREAANRLYRRCGFVERETNIYRYQG